MPATQTMILCFLLASGVSAVAQSGNGESGNGRCSNRTLNGDYGVALEGTFLPNTPFRGVVMQHYDGNGHITQVDHVVIYGMPPAQEWTPGTGTYTVNPDCTGVGVINYGVNPRSTSISWWSTTASRSTRWSMLMQSPPLRSKSIDR